MKQSYNSLLLAILLSFSFACSPEDEVCIEKTWFIDTDQDGFGDNNFQLIACEKPNGYVENNKDCNDSNNVINPDASEIQNDTDDNCNGKVDECKTNLDCEGVCVNEICVGDTTSSNDEDSTSLTHEFSKFDFMHDLTNTTLPYHFFEPAQSVNTSEKFPLIVCLHGAEYFATKEEDFLFNEVFAYYALAWLEHKNQKEYPAYVLAPHIYKEIWEGDDYNRWDEPNAIDFIKKLLEHIIDTKNIDTDRIYLTGHSMGGSGTWMVGAKLKDQFAALVPLSSAFSSDSPRFDELELLAENGDFANLPVWSFIHKRDADDSGDRHACRVLFEIFNNKGYNPTFTNWFKEINHNLNSEEINYQISNGKLHFYTEYNYDCFYGTEWVNNCHYSMTRALKDPLLFKWLFMQKKSR